MTRAGLTTLGAATAALVLAADQAAKGWVLNVIHLREGDSVPVLPVLSLTMVWNHGVTFGLLNGAGGVGRWGLAAVALAIVIGLGVWLRQAERPLVAVGLGAIIGGAVANNLIDRLRFGAVVDFIHFHAWGWSWYVFNVADAAIVCGVAALVLDGLLPHPRRRRGTRLADTHLADGDGRR
jgi:lipoprotein signal peptidase